MKFHIFTEKTAKILFWAFIAIFSIVVLARKIPEAEFVQNTVDRLEESQNTIMAFSGTTIATSLAISALPDDFASPLASTVSDLNTYFVFMFAVLFVEKLLVVEGIKIALMYIIPIACLLYVLSLLTAREMFKNFGIKLMILGISIIFVIPFSTHFTETVCEDYLDYVDETIAEADAGAAKINEVMASGNEESSFFDKLSNAFKTAIQSVTDLLNYFKNVIKKCVNSVAIMLVTTFVVPLLILMLFRWLLKELFALHIPMPSVKISLPNRRHDHKATKTELNSTESPELISMED